MLSVSTCLLKKLDDGDDDGLFMFAWIFRHSWAKMGNFRGKIGERVVRY